MAISLPPLPYPVDALEPHISRRTLELHHGAHHKKYVDTANSLIDGTPYANKPLEEIVRATAGDAKARKLFNNAAQAWNHSFFWQCMTPKGGGRPAADLERRIAADFGSLEKFRDTFVQTGAAQFGSGWVWLVARNGKLQIVSTGNADIPMDNGVVPLLTCDVWEHAYYLDYQNDRAKFVEVFLDKLANWRFAQDQLSKGAAMTAGNERDKPGIEGEGSYSAARDYQKGAEKTVASGQVEQKAREAKEALDGPESQDLKWAEEVGRNAAGGAASGAVRDNDKLKRAKAAPQGREAGYAAKIDPSVGQQPGVEGEGSYSATRDYNQHLEKTVKSGQVEQKAREAKEALEGPEGEELRNAERRGQMAAKMEDPSLHTRGKGKQQG
jgi:Fe-Mn family superoxide dismutase